MAASIGNFTLTPGGGWVQVVTGAVASYFRCRHWPKHTPVFYFVGTAAPAATAPGFRDDHGDFWADGSLTAGTNVWARISNNSNDSVQVSVYQN